VSLTDSPRNAVDSESSVGLALVVVLYFHYLGIMEQAGTGANVVAVPARYDDPLERPLYGHLATPRPDSAVQESPTWFDWDGELLRFAHTTKRQKYRNVQRNPRVAMSIPNPDNLHRYLEARGDVERIESDSAASFYRHLGDRCSGD
jgi:PPOX class probable F420-dependent enzyme